MAQPPIRKFYVGRALESVAALNDVLHDLTEHEVLHCITIEAESQRRKSMIVTLARRAARFNKQRFLKQLSEKFHAPYIVKDSE
jgi:hypothetical protein